MKKIIALCLCLLMVGLYFAGCRYVGKTEEYELYDRFARSHNVGMTKQEIFDELGYPDAYDDAQGQRYSVESEGDENNMDIFSDIAVGWCYNCHIYESSTDTYRLVIRFDSKGESTNAYMIGVN